MRREILTVLDETERREGVRILLAVESGSRAWGFASPDSDYDVRFIYVRPTRDYLRLRPVRDVIELPVTPVLDVNGWDLQKTLRLLCKFNPTVFEWLMSPLVYRETPFADRLRAAMAERFSQKKSMYHYLSMAEGNYRAYLRGDMVRAKKYFYVLRPLLACQWILERGTPPPMRFAELAAAELPAALRETVDALLAQKMCTAECGVIPRIPTLSAYLERGLAEMQACVGAMPDAPQTSPDALDALFLDALALM